MHPRKFVRDSVGLALSQYLARASLTLRAVVAAALVGPTAYGAWNALVLVLEYGAQSQLGTQQGLDQVVPQRLVEGDAARLERSKRAGLFNIVALGLLFCPLLALVFQFTGRQILGFWGWTGIAGVLGAMLLGNVLNYHATILRSHGDIAAVSSALMLQSVAGAGIGLALVLWVGVWGLLWGWLVGTFLALLYARTRSRGRVPLAPLPSRESRVLLGVGFPIFLFVSTTFVMRSLDRIVVLRFLGTTELGYYTLAVMAVTVLLYLSDSVSYVLYPRLVTRYRESGADATAMCGLALRPLRTVSLLLPWVTALAYLSADELVSWVLPAFRPGVSALRILSFGTVGLALGSIPAFTLITQGRMRQLVAVSVGGGLLALGLDLGAVAAGFGTKGIAAATLAAYFAYGALLQWLAFGSLVPRGAGRSGIILRLHAPLALAIALAYGVEHATPGLGLLDWQGLVRLLATLTLFTGLYVLAIRPFVAGLGLRGILAEFRMPGLAPERSAHGEGGA